MKKLIVLLCVCTLVLCSLSLIASADPLPSEMVEIDGFPGYKAFVYQDCSAESINIWTNKPDDLQASFEGGKLTLTGYGVWADGRITPKGSAIPDGVISAAEGYGFYIKTTAAMWIKTSYYIGSSNSFALPQPQTFPYVLVPSDGSEITEGTARDSGTFLVPANFDGYLLVKAPLSGLEGFTPSAYVGGNFNVTPEAPLVFDNFLVWSTYVAPPAPPVETADLSVIGFAAASITALGSLMVVKARKH